MGMEMNGLERDEALVARALFLLFYSQGDIQAERDIWAKEYPESAAIPYFDALQKFLKERSNPYIRAQDENYEKWRFQSAGDPRQALLYEWLSRASGKL